ncbi:hypothetical protein [Paenibacillus sinopodophylli]|uniref:YfjL-like protein n=1 Tax=Paenibacillus sinopodophylli TaxID=1837342 RepID=UPI00110CF51A|nr:hypothetical protein [Paenibacillus sinopodophylli]
MKKNILWIMTVIIIFMVILFWIFSLFYGTPWGKIKFKHDANEYLKKNYSHEMVLNSDVIYSFKENTYSVEVSPVELKDIKFGVWQNPNNKNELIDNYFIYYWTFQVNNELSKYLDSTFLNDKVSGKIIIQNSSAYEKNENTKSAPPNYHEIKKYLQEGTYIYIDIDKEINKRNLAEERDLIYKILNVIKKNNYLFNYIFVEYTKSSDIYFELDYEEFKQIENSSDISGYI